MSGSTPTIMARTEAGLVPMNFRFWPRVEFSHIDGRPRFAKHSINDGKQVWIAAIDPDF